MTNRQELHDRLQGLFDRIKEFPEGGRCEHGVHLKRDAYTAFLDLRKMIETELLPALARPRSDRR
jgi:hypothetical protein